MVTKKKPPLLTEDEQEVKKVIRRVNIIEADTMSDLEDGINRFLETIKYNDLGGYSETTQLYYFAGKFYAKIEYDVRIKG